MCQKNVYSSFPMVNWLNSWTRFSLISFVWQNTMCYIEIGLINTNFLFHTLILSRHRWNYLKFSGRSIEEKLKQPINICENWNKEAAPHYDSKMFALSTSNGIIFFECSMSTAHAKCSKKSKGLENLLKESDLKLKVKQKKQ